MCLIIKKAYSSRRNNSSDIEFLEPCYSDNVPIALAKLDLLSLCQGRIIPQVYHSFHQQLSHSGTVTEQNSSDSSD